jgi:hypothetical protein
MLLKLVCELFGQETMPDKALTESGKEEQRLAIQDGRQTTVPMSIRSTGWNRPATMCVHADGKTLVLHGTIERREELRDPRTFNPIRRSAIVNRLRARSHCSRTETTNTSCNLIAPTN